MTTKETKTITGELAENPVFKFDKNGKEYVGVKIVDPQKRFPVSLSGFDTPLVERFKKARQGMVVTLQYTESTGTYEGRPVTYHNIVAIGPVAAAQHPSDVFFSNPLEGEPPQD